jgi:hypothetical protein
VLRHGKEKKMGSPAVPNPNGLPIVDAKRPIRVLVRPIDVKRGAKLEPQSCAFALALKRQTHCVEARVFRSVTYVTHKTRIVRYKTPEAAARELIAFDRGGSFEPAEYTFSPFGKSLLLVGSGGKPKPTGPKKTKSTHKKPYHITAMVRKASAS